MTYKGIEIGEKPTLGMVIEFLNKNKNFVVNASELFYKYEDRNWLTKKGKPIKTLESIIVAENGVQVLKRRKDIRKNKEKTRKEIWEKYSTKEPKKEETKSYSELLKDPRWQKKRLEIMERDNWSCLKCGCGLNDGTPLNVHHKYYRKGRAPWEYDDSCYVTLCEKCHAKQHAK